MTDQLPFGDHPINNHEQDLLGREPLAAIVADQIVRMDASQGAVVGILGAWGTGKTSLLNLVLEKLESEESFTVVQFNPWLFSGVEQITSALLSQIYATLKSTSAGWKARKKINKAASAISDYAKSLLPAAKIIPVVRDVYTAALGSLDLVKTASNTSNSIAELRSKARKELALLPGRIVVAVDDIDRLSKIEIRDLMRAVRLTAQFPNVIYVLCMDDSVVSSALEEQGFSGEAYLEKIITLTVNVPSMSTYQIEDLFLSSLNNIVDADKVGPYDQAVWNVAFPYVIQPMLRTPRDPKRVLSSLPISLARFEKDLPIADVVTLESLRVLQPRLHRALLEHAEVLTTKREHRGASVESKDDLADLWQEDSSKNSAIARAVVAALFPEAAPTDSELPRVPRSYPGVAQRSGLDLYISGQLPPDTARPSHIRVIIEALGDRETLPLRFQAVEPSRLRDALAQILPYCQELEAPLIASSIPAFADQIARLPERRGEGFFSFRPEVYATRCLYQLIKRDTPESVYETVKDYAQKSQFIYPAHKLVMMVGHRDHLGHKIVTPDQAKELEFLIFERILNAGDDLAEERDLAVLLYRYHSLFRRAEDNSIALPALQEPAVIAKIFTSAVQERRMNVVGTSLRGKEDYLEWDIIVKIFGSEENVRRSLHLIRTSRELSATDEAVCALVEKYLSGWRPEFPGD